MPHITEEQLITYNAIMDSGVLATDMERIKVLSERRGVPLTADDVRFIRVSKR